MRRVAWVACLLGLVYHGASQQYREVFVYNRVMRSGSTAMLELVEELSKRNNFTFLSATDALWDSAPDRRPLGIDVDDSSYSATAQRVGWELARLIDDLPHDAAVFIHGHVTIDAVRTFQNEVGGCGVAHRHDRARPRREGSLRV